MTREASKRFFFLSCLSIDNGYEPVKLLSPTSSIAVPDCRGSLAVGGRYELQFPISKETQNQGSYMDDRATILRHYHNQVCSEIRLLEWPNLISSTPLSSTHAARMPINCWFPVCFSVRHGHYERTLKPRLKIVFWEGITKVQTLL
jgi:hypothetical protein